MRSVNKVFLLGHLGQDPEVKYTSAGTSYCRMSLATNEQWIDNDNQKQERVEWHNLVVWNELAEACGKYLKKGSKLHVEGAIRYGKFEKDGVDIKTTDIRVYALSMLDSKPKDAKSKQSSKSQITDDDIPF